MGLDSADTSMGNQPALMELTRDLIKSTIIRPRVSHVLDLYTSQALSLHAGWRVHLPSFFPTNTLRTMPAVLSNLPQELVTLIVYEVYAMYINKAYAAYRTPSWDPLFDHSYAGWVALRAVSKSFELVLRDPIFWDTLFVADKEFKTDGHIRDLFTQYAYVLDGRSVHLPQLGTGEDQTHHLLPTRSGPLKIILRHCFKKEGILDKFLPLLSARLVSIDAERSSWLTRNLPFPRLEYLALRGMGPFFPSKDPSELAFSCVPMVKTLKLEDYEYKSPGPDLIDSIASLAQLHELDISFREKREPVEDIDTYEEAQFTGKRLVLPRLQEFKADITTRTARRIFLALRQPVRTGPLHTIVFEHDPREFDLEYSRLMAGAVQHMLPFDAPGCCTAIVTTPPEWSISVVRTPDPINGTPVATHTVNYGMRLGSNYYDPNWLEGWANHEITHLQYHDPLDFDIDLPESVMDRITRLSVCFPTNRPIANQFVHYPELRELVLRVDKKGYDRFSVDWFWGSFGEFAEALTFRYKLHYVSVVGDPDLVKKLRDVQPESASMVRVIEYTPDEVRAIVLIAGGHADGDILLRRPCATLQAWRTLLECMSWKDVISQNEPKE
jgi:hypothetical protein